MSLLQRKFDDLSAGIAVLEAKGADKLNEAEQRQLQAMVDSLEILEAEMTKPQPRAGRLIRADKPGDDITASVPASAEWRDTKTGQPVYALRRDQRWSDLPELRQADVKPEALSIGRAIRAIITGRWKDAEGEQRAMSGSVNTAGGFVVPDILMAQLIDKARAKSVLQQAGMITMPMSSDHATLARVSTDPTWTPSKGENSAFTETQFAFEEIGMTAHTGGCLMYASRELAEDGINFVQQVEAALAAAWAAELDRLAINGGASLHPTGLINHTGINTSAAMGACVWTHLSTGILACEVDNATPNAILISPTNVNKLSVLLVAAEANHYSDGMNYVKRLPMLVSTNVADANLIVGDFTQMVMGLRQGALIETTTTGGDAFAKHQVGIKLTWRGDFGLLHPDHFWVGAGVS